MTTEMSTTVSWKPTKGDVTAGIESVGVRGTFSTDPKRWWQQTIPLQYDPDTGHYHTSLSLPPGRYEFKFVINDNDWRVDSEDYEQADDGGGNVNNVITVQSGVSAPAAASGIGEPSSRSTAEIATERTKLLASRTQQTTATNEVDVEAGISNSSSSNSSRRNWMQKLQKGIVWILLIMVCAMLGAASEVFHF